MQIFLTQNYNVFKMSALGLFLKYSYNFANFSLDIPIKCILIEKAEKLDASIVNTRRKHLSLQLWTTKSLSLLTNVSSMVNG